MREHHTGMHAVRQPDALRGNAVHEDALTSAWMNHQLISYKRGALSQTPVLCQPTTLLCGNPEKRSRDSKELVERLKKEGRS